MRSPHNPHIHLENQLILNPYLCDLINGRGSNDTKLDIFRNLLVDTYEKKNL